jgi:hypothetical protein
MALGNVDHGTMKPRGYNIMIQEYAKRTGLVHNRKQMRNITTQLKNFHWALKKLTMLLSSTMQ